MTLLEELIHSTQNNSHAKKNVSKSGWKYEIHSIRENGFETKVTNETNLKVADQEILSDWISTSFCNQIFSIYIWYVILGSMYI